jgi:hypothetical protein
MATQVIILHGWSDKSESFRSLRDFLVANGRTATEVWLSDYISLDDDVRIDDVSKRMDDVVRAGIADGTITVPFDLIVHSTGGLVARHWISTFYPDGRALADKMPCPVKRLVMLAPANFGSALAAKGKSMLGRVVKGWNNWFQTGTEMLQALELGSEFQWNLALNDLFDREGDGRRCYGKNRVWPFVIAGTKGYTDLLRQIVNENGSDGTVRCAAANLNAAGITIDFSEDSGEPRITTWPRRSGDVIFPFAILPDRDHSSVHEPVEATGAAQIWSDRLGELILEALGVATDTQYRNVQQRWAALTEETGTLGDGGDLFNAAFGNTRPNAGPEALHQYFQVSTYVRDDEGRPVDDFFLEFFAPEQRGAEHVVYFHREVMEDVHTNTLSAARRCLYIDRTDLMFGFYPLMKSAERQQLAMSISAAPPGRNITYFEKTNVGAKGHVVVHRFDDDKREDLEARLIRNCTHLVEIIIPRRAVDKVFSVSR